MGKLFGLLVVFLLALITTEADPLVYFGGSFIGIQGTGFPTAGPNLAAYNTTTGLWSQNTRPIPIANGGTVNSIAGAGNGVMAVGSFTLTSDPNGKNVAFWDGSKWCALAQSPQGQAKAVFCDSSSSCWVAGSFTGINNLAGNPAVQNVVHYTFDGSNNEWLVDTNAFFWNSVVSGSVGPLPGVDADSLVGIGSGSSITLFAYSAGTIYRGSAALGGWYTFASTNSLNGGGIAGWSLDVSASALYVVTTGSVMAMYSGSLTGTDTQTSVPGNWTVYSSFDATIYGQFSLVGAGGKKVYVVGLVDPDGASTGYQARWQVFAIPSISSSPQLVGQPFTIASGGQNPITKLKVLADGTPLVFGPTAGNLYYPPNTNDSTGVTVDRRLTDSFNYMAVWNTSASRWVQAFGGGLQLPNSNPPLMTFNSQTSQYFFFGGFSAVYDVHVESAAFYDNDPTLQDSFAFYPLFYRRLTTRPGPLGGISCDSPGQNCEGNVWSLACSDSSCGKIFIGGQFQFHGPDIYGAIAEVTVDHSGQPLIAPVGGGLWFNDAGKSNQDPTYQSYAGIVYAMAVDGNTLFVGGLFGRGGTDYVCLNNIGQIDISQQNSAFQDLSGGCDSPNGNYGVFDLQIWEGVLYATGDFTKCGGQVVNYVASYSYQNGDNAQWSALNYGLDSDGFALEVFSGRLIVAGQFTHAGGLPVPGVASWNGFRWRALYGECQNDCDNTPFNYYSSPYANPTTNGVYALRTDLSGGWLWAIIEADDVKKNEHLFLAKWQYTSGDSGQWFLLGDMVTLDGFGYGAQTVTNFGEGFILAPGATNAEWKAVGGDVVVFDSINNNWVVDSRSVIGQYVIALLGPEAGSAGCLSSPLSFLLSLF
jgi:hypothetical protein